MVQICIFDSFNTKVEVLIKTVNCPDKIKHVKIGTISEISNILRLQNPRRLMAFPSTYESYDKEHYLTDLRLTTTAKSIEQQLYVRIRSGAFKSEFKQVFINIYFVYLEKMAEFHSK